MDGSAASAGSSCKLDNMAKKRKLDKVQLVKEMSRERIGQVPTEKLVPNKRRERLEQIREREAREEQ